jgi:hypothetical protein
VVLCPPVKALSECCGLSAPSGQIPPHNGDEHNVTFVGEVRDIFGDDGPSFCPSFCPSHGRDLRVLGRAEPDVCDMDSVVAVTASR